MKTRIRKMTSLLLSFSLLGALSLPAAASEALGEDLSAKDTVIHEETQLSTNVFWSTAYSDLRTENLITYSPNKTVTPIVTYGGVLTDRSSVADTANALDQRRLLQCVHRPAHRAGNHGRRPPQQRRRVLRHRLPGGRHRRAWKARR